MNNKIILMLSILTFSLLLFGCQASQQPEGLPEPAGTGSALAGQGFSTGVYDQEYQLYNRMKPTGVEVFLVEGENWVQLLRPAGSIGGRSILSWNDLSVLELQTTMGSMEGKKLSITSACSNYDVEFDRNGNYRIFDSDGRNIDSFSVPLNRAQPIRQIAGTSDAITIHLSTIRASWFTLHCDTPVRVNVPLLGRCTRDSECDPLSNLCGQGSGSCSTATVCDVLGGGVCKLRGGGNCRSHTDCRSGSWCNSASCMVLQGESCIPGGGGCLAGECWLVRTGASGFRCMNRVGGSCQSGNGCESNNCLGGVCQSMRLPGDSCIGGIDVCSDSTCVNGFCV